MNQKRVVAFLAIAVVLARRNVLAQATPNGPVPTTTTTSPAPTKEVDEKVWSFSASAYTYFLPDARDYTQPTFMADRDWLHLEVRYNYEGLEAGSAWIGYNFSFGEKLTLDITPMVGGVFGNTSGFAPGYRASLSWRKLEASSESEYVFDTGTSSDSFLYTWSELTLAPVDWCRFGLAVQRTKLYETEFDIQRGVLVGFAYKKVEFTTYVFNPDASPPTVVLGVGLSF